MAARAAVVVSKRCCNSPISAVVSASLKPSDCGGAAAGDEGRKGDLCGEGHRHNSVCVMRGCSSLNPAVVSASLKPSDCGGAAEGHEKKKVA